MSPRAPIPSVACAPSTDAERGFIETWEVEAYRRGAAAFGRDAGRFSGRIALVTGAAQGFGLEIARGLADAGGHVVLADVNAEGAAEQARELEARLGPGAPGPWPWTSRTTPP